MTDIATLGIQVRSDQVPQAQRRLRDLEQTGGRTERATDRLRNSFSRMAGPLRMLAGAAGFGGVAVSMRNLVRNTAEQERITAELTRTLEATGRAIELADIQAFSAEMQDLTTFSNEAVEEVVNMNARLTELSDDGMLRATRAALDMAAATGTDATQAADRLARSLANPERAVTRLQRSGVFLNQETEQLIENLVEQGHHLKAQETLLSAVEDQMGGAAREARNTLGGAFSALSNTMGDMLKADDGLPGLTGSLNDLNDTLSDPAFQQAVGNFFGTLASGAGMAADALVRLDQASESFTNFMLQLPEFGGAEGLGLAEIESQVAETNRLLQEQARLIHELPEGSANQERAILRANEMRRRQNLLLERRQELLARQNELDSFRVNPDPFEGFRAGGFSEHLWEGGQAGAGTPDLMGLQAQLEGVLQSTVRAQEFQAEYNEALEEGERLTDAMRTPMEVYQDSLESIWQLFQRGAIDAETMARASEDAWQRMADASEESTEQMSQFAIQAQRTIQSTLGDSLAEMFRGNFDNILDMWIDMLIRMAAEATAASIMDGIGDGGGGEGFWAGFASIFGRASGGRVNAGQPYIGAEGGRGEMFIPDSSGEVVPNHRMGGAQLNPTWNIDARGANREAVLQLMQMQRENNRQMQQWVDDRMRGRAV